MARRKNPNPSTRYRFSVPSQDKVVAEWIAKQSNMSASIHVMIRAFVRQFGFADAMCVEFGTTRRPVGRPPKGFQDMFDSMGVGPAENQADSLESPDVRPDTAGGTGTVWSTPDVKPKTATKPAKAEPPVQAPKAPESKPAERPEPVDEPDDGMELPGTPPEEAPEDYRSQLAGIFGGAPVKRESVSLEMPD